MKDRQLLVLVVEPERPLANLFQLDLTENGHRVNVVHSAEHALKVLTPEYDVVVTSMFLPQMTGEGFVMALRAHAAFVDMPVLVIAPGAELPASMRDDVTTLRRKPFNLEHFVDYVKDAAGPGRFRN